MSTSLNGKRVAIVGTDGHLISSRQPDDIPAFSRELIGALSE